MPLPSSKTQIDRAGGILRQWWAEANAVDLGSDPKLIGAVTMIWAHRAAFQYPLIKVTANLRYYVKREDEQAPVAQRLKRLGRIVEKLTRFPNMRLSQMRDVGGCRAILPTQNGVQGALAGIQRNWDIIDIDDYVAQPKATGYRGIHVIVKRDEVPIEVQLRTPVQQAWADLVERVDGRFRLGLKDDRGPDDVREWFRLLGEVLALEETGQPVRGELNARLGELSSAVGQYLRP